MLILNTAHTEAIRKAVRGRFDVISQIRYAHSEEWIVGSGSDRVNTKVCVTDKHFLWTRRCVCENVLGECSWDGEKVAENGN